MSQILLIDPSPLCQELISLALRSNGFVVESCLPEKTSEMMNSIKPRLLIYEPGGAGGLSLLRMLRRDPRYRDLPVIILTEAATKESVLEAATFGVRDYMVKQRFSQAELLTRVRKYVVEGTQKDALETAASVTPDATVAGAKAAQNSKTSEDDQQLVRETAEKAGVPLLSREQMLGRIESAPIKTLPGAVAELLALIGSPRGSVNDVAHSLKRDPVLSSRVLRAANSVAFSSNRVRIASVEDAVKHIGLSGVRNLVTSVGVIETYTSASGGQSLLRTWQHSLAVAALMDAFTPKTDSSPPGVAYVVGLCHDLADIVLRQYFCTEYGRVVELTETTGRPQREVESAVFGLPYSELISLLLSRVGLPGVVTAPIQEFFERALYRQAPGTGSILGRTLRIANFYAHGLMLAPGLDEPVAPLSVVECRGTFGDQLPKVDDAAIRGDALTNASVLAGLSASETAKACEPAIPKLGLRVCYVRPAEFAEIDPLHTLLRLTTEKIDVRSRVPAKPAEIAGFDVVIVADPHGGDLSEAQRALTAVGKLVEFGSPPAMYLSASPSQKFQAAPANVTVGRLPISVQSVGAFLHAASKKTMSRAA